MSGCVRKNNDVCEINDGLANAIGCCCCCCCSLIIDICFTSLFTLLPILQELLVLLPAFPIIGEGRLKGVMPYWLLLLILTLLTFREMDGEIGIERDGDIGRGGKGGVGCG